MGPGQGPARSKWNGTVSDEPLWFGTFPVLALMVLWTWKASLGQANLDNWSPEQWAGSLLWYDTQ